MGKLLVKEFEKEVKNIRGAILNGYLKKIPND